MAEARYHVRFEDGASGESLGLMLVERPQLGISRRLINPYAAKAGTGETRDHDLTEWCVWSQRDWRGGRGQEEWEDATAFFDAHDLETRIRGQLTLGPLPINWEGDFPKYEPGDVDTWGVGWTTVGVTSYKVHRAQSFVCPAGGIICTHVDLYLRMTYRYLGTVLTVRLREDAAGNPGNVLKSDTITNIPEDGRWMQADWAGQALVGGNTYWIEVYVSTGYPPAPVPPGQSYEDFWGGLSTGGYAGGVSKRGLDGANWSASNIDFYFRINSTELEDAPVAFARYDDKWYCGAGDTVYVWDETDGEWDVSEQVAGQDVTALETWGGYLWVARGAGDDVRRYNGAAWADAPGSVTATLLKGGGGYLHRTGTGSNDHKVYYTVNGTDWAEIEVGNGDYGITGMEWYRDMLVVATAVRLWGTAADKAYPLLSWHSQEDDDNGRGMMVWTRTGGLYIPLLYGLYRWNGDTMVAVGPEQGMGLPGDRAGKVSALVGTGNWLFAAIDAGANGYSSVLAYNGMGGWHEMYRAEQTGQRIKATGFETVHSPSRLWIGLDKQMRYLQLPDTSDNPWQWSGYEFNGGGEYVSSWLGGDLLEVVKDLWEVVVRGEEFNGVDPGQGDQRTVDVYYEVDRSGLWTYLGHVTESPRQALAFEASDFAAKVVGSGSTRTKIELGSGDTGDLWAGKWVRINAEVAQVESVTDGDTFVLATALSAAPASGDGVYASRPAGREFRIKLVLATADRTKTPKVTAVMVRYQNNVLDRYVYVLSIRVEDGLKNLAKKPYPWTAAELRVELDKWAQRVTPFTLYDPDGVAHTVKVVAGGEGGYEAQVGEALPARWGSVYTMNVVEVG